MEIIYQERASGKTHELIKKSARNNVHIGVINQSQKDIIQARAKAFGLKIPCPVVIQSLDDLNNYGALYIDDFDCLMDKLTNGNIKIVTVSRENII